MTMTPDAASILDAAAVLRELLRPIQERQDAQDARIATLEQRPIGAIDCGVWQPGTYPRGGGVTHGGAFWVAQRDTQREPADGNDDWRLCVHRGRPGRQGPPGPACQCAARRAS
jgi:hypothetical protein